MPSDIAVLRSRSLKSVPATGRPEPPGLPAQWWRLLDTVVWLGLALVILLTVTRHEPWADEAQSWLLARDLGWFQLIFGELRYEGHPGLWHSIL